MRRETMVFTSLPPPSTAGFLHSIMQIVGTQQIYFDWLHSFIWEVGILGGLIETVCIKELLKLQSPKDIITDNNHFILNKIIS